MRILCKKLGNVIKPRSKSHLFAPFALVLSGLLATLLVTTQWATPLAFAQQTESPTEHVRWKAKIIEIKTNPTAGPGVPMLKWTPEEVWVDSQGPVQYARIRWVIQGQYQSVSVNGRPVKPKANGAFDVNFGFTNNEKAFRVTVLDQDGRTFQGSYKIASTGETAERVSTAPTKRYRFNAGIGATSIQYTQQGVATFNEIALTVKGGVSFRLVPDKIDLSLSSFLNAFVIKSTSEYEIRYLGVNLRAGYHLVRAPSAFRVVLNGGFYYNTSFGTIGFSNMYGPQLYPEFSYILNNGHAILNYVKFSPALFDGRIDFSRNKEVATGLYYVFPLDPKTRMAIGFDLSKLDLATGTDSASTTTYSLSAGLSF